MSPEQWAAWDSYPKGLVVDPHDSRPFMMAWFHVDPRDRIMVFEEWPRQKFHDAKAPDFGIPGYADLIKAIEGGDNFWGRPIKNLIWRIMDPQFGRSPSASNHRTPQDEFGDYLLGFDCTVDNDVTTGHLAVRQLLDEPVRLFVTPNCTNIIEGFDRYVYEEPKRNAGEMRKEKKPKEEYKDSMDVIRYLAMSDVRWFDTGPVKAYAGAFPKNMGLG